MSRPRGYARGRWFAQRRNRRGRPVTLRSYDEIIARVLGTEVRIADLAELARTAAHMAHRDNPIVAAFRKVTRIESFYVPPLFEQRKEPNR